MSAKNQFRLANAGGTVDRLRGNMISETIGVEEKLPFPDQVAVLMNALDHIFDKLQELHGEDFRTEEWRSCMHIREASKKTVDNRLKALGAEEALDD